MGGRGKSKFPCSYFDRGLKAPKISRQVSDTNPHAASYFVESHMDEATSTWHYTLITMTARRTIRYNQVLRLISSFQRKSA